MVEGCSYMYIHTYIYVIFVRYIVLKYFVTSSIASFAETHRVCLCAREREEERNSKCVGLDEIIFFNLPQVQVHEPTNYNFNAVACLRIPFFL